MHDAEQGGAWYAAFKAKDARFDGRVFMGVLSTGIYCRPLCTAKMPRKENCLFFDNAAAAERAGFRPCLLCRPELAPGTGPVSVPVNVPVDATRALVHRAARLLEAHCGTGQSIAEFAQRLGCSERHLRRAFTAEFQVSPLQYVQTCRLLLAKNLLTDTSLSVTDVAMTSGFGSLRRFNAVFKKQYRLSPTALRKRAPSAKENAGALTLSLTYRPPYRWQHILDFLAFRAIPGVEVITANGYARTLRFTNAAHEDVVGWIQVSHCPLKNALALTLSPTLVPVLAQVLARVRHLFDLECEPDVVYEALAGMNAMRSGLCLPGTRVPGCIDPFEMSVRAVLGQQITVKAATTLAGRFAAAFGAPLETGLDGVTHVFPSAAFIAALSEPIGNHLGPLGIIGRRAASILALAQSFVRGEIDFLHCAQPEVEMQKLRAIPGIGDWTAQYIALRAMNWPDAFPHTDYGIKKALAPLTEKEILHLAETWRPWRSYATINLWNSL